MTIKISLSYFNMPTYNKDAKSTIYISTSSKLCSNADSILIYN